MPINHAWKAVLSCALCASCAPAVALHHTPDGRYQTDDHGYAIAQLPDGKLMPAGWMLQNYSEKDGALLKSDAKDARDVAFGRSDDGFLFITTKHISTMGKRTLLSILHDFVNGHIAEQRHLLRADLSEGKPRAIAGGEGLSLTVEIRENPRTPLLSRVYYLCFWPPSHEEVSVLVYANNLPAFDAAMPEVEGLVDRIVYK